MRGPHTRRFGLMLAAVTLPALVVGSAVAGSAALPAAQKLAPATLNGSGSSLQLGFDQVMIGDFKKQQKSVTINYASKGSGTGRQELADQVTNFAGSDSPYPADDAPASPILYFPTVAAPVTIAYNLPGVDSLQLSAATIAGIFMGQITSWDDPAIADENPNADLPSTEITVAVRSDSSGTTDNFTNFLTKAAADVYTLGKSSKPAWPASNQQGAQNTGVAQIVTSTEGAIGYVDFSDAQAIGLTYAKVQNSDGKFVKPSTSSASKAVAAATVNPDLTYDPINQPGAKTYPITAPTYIIVYQSQTDAAKGEAIQAFLKYIYGAGQTTAPEIDYAPLSGSLLKQAKAQVKDIQISAS
jgi:phosphate transport system substrate-binding protein